MPGGALGSSGSGCGVGTGKGVVLVSMRIPNGKVGVDLYALDFAPHFWGSWVSPGVKLRVVPCAACTWSESTDAVKSFIICIILPRSTCCLVVPAAAHLLQLPARYSEVFPVTALPQSRTGGPGLIHNSITPQLSPDAVHSRICSPLLPFHRKGLQGGVL